MAPKRKHTAASASSRSRVGNTFRDQAEAARFDRVFQQRPLVLERRVILDDLESTGVPAMLRQRGWVSLVTEIVAPSAEMVREFYANIHVVTPHLFSVFFRGKELEVTPSLVRAHLRLPEVVNPTYPWSSRDAPSPQAVYDHMAPVSVPYLGTHAVPAAQLHHRIQILHRIVAHNLFSVSHTNTVPFQRLRFLYAIDTGVSIDLSDVIVGEMVRVASSDSTTMALPYGCLLQRLLMLMVPRLCVDADPVVLIAPINNRTIASGRAHTSRQRPSAAASSSAGPSAPPAVPRATLAGLAEALGSVMERMDHMSQRVDWMYTRMVRQAGLTGDPAAAGPYVDPEDEDDADDVDDDSEDEGAAD